MRVTARGPRTSHDRSRSQTGDVMTDGGRIRRSGWCIGPLIAALLLAGCTGTSPSTGPAAPSVVATASPETASPAAASQEPTASSTPSPTPTEVAEASPSAVPGPSASIQLDAAGCPIPPVDLATTRDLARAGQAVRCFGSGSLTFRAYVPTTEGLGGSSASRMTPAWLADDWTGVILQPGPLAEQDQDAWLVVRVGPSLGHCAITYESDPACPFGPHLDGYVVVTGHFDDPAARTCKSARWAAGQDPGPSKANMVARCRARFVVTKVEAG